MTGKEKRDVINKLTAYIHCLKCQRSGKVCNDNCPTQYEAGNCGEIIKNLEFLLEEVKMMPILSKSAYNSLAFYEPLELCEDTISREAMLKIQAKYAEYMGATKFWQMWDDIKALPPVTPVQGWISCSEKMPKANEYVGNVAKYYLVQNEYEDMMVAHYNGKYWEQMYQLGPIKNKIVAWCELPRLYKGNKKCALQKQAERSDRE